MNSIQLTQFNSQLCQWQRKSNPYRLCVHSSQPWARSRAASPVPQPALPSLDPTNRGRISEAQAGVGRWTRCWFHGAFVLLCLTGALCIVANHDVRDRRTGYQMAAQAQRDRARLHDLQIAYRALAAEPDRLMARSPEVPQPRIQTVSFAQPTPARGSRL